MSYGCILHSRSIVSTTLFANPLAFRFWVLLLSKAAYKNGLKAGDLTLEVGQWVRSYRQLSKDLEYVDGRALRRPALSKLGKLVKRFIDNDEIIAKETRYGTLFTVVNYHIYQDFCSYKNFCENASETHRERTENNKKQDHSRSLKFTHSNAYRDQTLKLDPAFESRSVFKNSNQEKARGARDD